MKKKNLLRVSSYLIVVGFGLMIGCVSGSSYSDVNDNADGRGVALHPPVDDTQGTGEVPPPVEWQPCDVSFDSHFECATVEVPLDHQRPGPQPMVPIAMVRLPATDPARRIGSLFLNPGGPGGSGVNFVLDAGPTLYTEEVRARFDIVGFDPRGIARSNGLSCFHSDEQLESVLQDTPFPVTEEEFRVFQRNDWRLAFYCRLLGDRIQDFMTTADVARDLDLLRQAVGDDQLTYAGFSYGSYLGVTYANLFPERVRAVIVDGVLDPIAWSTGRGLEKFTTPVSARIGSEVGASATLAQFFKLCEAAGEACAFSGDSAARFAAFAERLKVKPVEIELPDGEIVFVDYASLVDITIGALYDSFAWPDFATLLVNIESASAVEAGVAYERLFLDRGIRSRSSNNIEQTIEGFPAVLCTDSDNPWRYRIWKEVAESFDREGDYFGAAWTWFSSPCATWLASNHSRYTGPFTRHTANPVLVVSTLYDPATPHEGAVTVADLLPNSRLLTVDGWGHTTLSLSECATQAASEYLLNGTLPEEGAVCTQDQPPFPTQSMRSSVRNNVREQRAHAMSEIMPTPMRNRRYGSADK